MIEIRTNMLPSHDDSLSAERRNHRLVRGQLFYTLPAALLRGIVAVVGQERFDAERLALEADLSLAVGDHGYAVGFRDGQPVPCHLLEDRRPIRIGRRNAAAWGLEKSDEELRELERQATGRIDRFSMPVRAYAGWLMSTPTFVAEHDELICRHQSRLRQYGFPRPRLHSNELHGTGGVRRRTPADGEWTREFRSFFSRWRLQTLTGTGLPLPLAPQLPDILQHSTGTVAEGTAHFSIPDIFPLHGRGEVHEVMQDAVRGDSGSEHLSEWFGIVGPDSTTANMIPRFVRLFRLQHFVRVLYSRHADALQRRKTHLREALADYLTVSEDAVKRDWKFLDDRLGPEWPQRAVPLI